MYKTNCYERPKPRSTTEQCTLPIQLCTKQQLQLERIIFKTINLWLCAYSATTAILLNSLIEN